MKTKRNPVPSLVVAGVFGIFVAVSFATGFTPGRQIGRNFVKFGAELISMLPFVFILVGLFEAWVKREAVERHLGSESGARAFFWCILLGATTIGGVIMALPVADSLRRKGAGMSAVLTYLGAAAVCRIPMTAFEASYLGIGFTAVRYGVSIPLIIGTSVLLGRILERKALAQ